MPPRSKKSQKSKSGPSSYNPSSAPPFSKKNPNDTGGILLEVKAASSKSVFIPCSKLSAEVSPLLKKSINGTVEGSQSGSEESDKSEEIPNDIQLSSRMVKGQLVVELSSKGCNEQSVRSIVKWCDFHIHDRQFAETCRFAEFDKDLYDRKHNLLTELPSSFDWHFIKEVGGGDNLQQERRAGFYDLMVVANTLGLWPLVELGAKYLRSQLENKDVRMVRDLLGIKADIDPEFEERILKENSQILKKN